MNKIISTLLASLFFLSLHAQDAVLARHPTVVTGKLVRVTKALRDMTAADRAMPEKIVRDLNGIIGKDQELEEGTGNPVYPSAHPFTVDPALQTIYPARPHTVPDLQRAIVTNFNGMGYQPLNPPDPSLCAGPNHVIEMINGSTGALFQIYNKSGTVLVAQTSLHSITGKGGLGDPITLYDQLADRFVLTEFADKSQTGSEGLIFAVSKTNDPTGQWYVYFFSTGSTFPDYPKFSTWTDAYYATTNDFANGSTYAGSSVYAFDKAKMIAGNSTATMQKFTLGNTNKFFSMSPVNLEGSTLPPAGSGGLIAYMQDDTWTSSTTDVDSIGLIEFKVDFTTPSNTVVTTKSSFATSPYKSDICSATRGQCISQPGTTTKLEGLEGKIMNQPIYRRFGGYEGIVLTHLVDRGGSVAASRWYELRKTTGNWGIYQQSTYSPDATHRWLPTVCYDTYGNIGLAYNVSSSSIYPGAKYTGRKECDALNTMTYTEDIIIAGTASNSSTRYGDYNHLVCDPDGVTFWFTCEYNAASTWSTRIASFTLDPCTPPLCGNPTGLSASGITNTSANLSWAAVTNALNYDVDYKPSSSTTWLSAAVGTTSTSVTLSTLTQGTAYDWRVLAHCSAGAGNYVSSQFTTTSPQVCNPPSGLTASSITSTGATVNWTAVTGAVSYTVDYKANTSSTWINAATATTATSVAISGLTASTLYDWRVLTNCSSGSSTYSTSQFTTTATQSGCVNAYEANETQATSATIPINTNISAAIATATDIDYYNFTTTGTNDLTVTLTNLPGDYDLYFYNSAGTQIGSSTNGGTTNESITYNNAAAGTYYVKVIGYNGASSTTVCYNLKAATATASVCPGPYDVSTNGTFGGASAIPFNTDIKGLISPSGDKDYYKFTITNPGSITVTLGTLPADYDLALYNSAQIQVGISQNGGTTSETINYNAAAGTYYVYVYGYNNHHNSSSCYTLKVALGTASSPEIVKVVSDKKLIDIFPNPATNVLNVNITGYSGNNDILVFDINGRLVLKNKTSSINSQLDISKLPSGSYLVKVFNSDRLLLNKKIQKH